MHRYFKTLLAFSLILFSACSASKDHSIGGLTIEEHILSEAPSSDPFKFQPMDGTQAEILSVHEDQRRQVISVPVFMEDGNPALKASWGGSELTALVFTDAGKTPEQIVKISTPKETIFTTSAGMPSPVMPLQGLWTYGRHWALEILYATPEVWTGQIFIDGALLNQERDYYEAFGFQLLSGKPFYFFQRNGLIGISYDGQEANLDYSNILHYLCCSESALNPIAAESMVAFFAQRAETWYYVEMGYFK